MEGSLFNIQRFSIHDGPGIRTTVFFKGCNLNCKWCHNPESIKKKNQLEFYPEKCIGCGACFQVCLYGAHYLNGEGDHRIDRSKCTGCLLCTKTCYANALIGVGQKVTVPYLLKSILEDKLYYENSNGGVTFSGGEVMLQLEFLIEILTKCRDFGIHTAVDTAGCVPWSYFEQILPMTDLFLYDVKAADSKRHKLLTGVENHLILENLRRLSEEGKDIIVRIPFIPGQNDDQISEIAELLKPLRIIKAEVMPYHKLGNSKYAALGIENKLLHTETPAEEMVQEAVEILRSYGIKADKT
ncbi:glycyl-radical enzyme activating protein [Anaerocolumna sp. AGMB13025]|uniref:glycyl-radical enzyme activating protein n=1 Tax=Anaerocolumna sp. AGMB13025 TaxID=3039116 RepID=UPI00241E83E3|nr:glycyl-radical enzyme activating protein [Anaerocolumna sp. AGMB13025]WFR56286.1 glycyl-radical enzyme activating protein [Anaerocolumna sp. AGMB13025]